ncbi:MAG: hypothetical protein RL607_1140 [Bacteroidota bacterium]|jgi:uncharacterized protein YvpB
MEEKKITFIEGSFQVEEAFELLTKLMNYKIQFHHQDDFSKSIRNVKQTQHSQDRIAALDSALLEVKQFLKVSQTQDTRYKIYSEIHIVREE